MTINREIWLSRADETAAEAALIDRIWEELNSERGWRFETVQVSMNDLVAVLSGTVPRLPDKLSAERLATRVPKVQGVVNRIAVVLADDDVRRDAELTRIASYALDWCSLIPSGRVHVMAKKGRVTLHGDVNADHERAAAEETMQRLVGVREVVSRIVVPSPSPSSDPVRVVHDMRDRVDRALHHDPMLRGQHIEVDGGPAHVILRGTWTPWRSGRKPNAWRASWQATHA